ncbi:MAG: hypothetical protein HQK76_16595 [Desulfobacterales bacterium]|nr:hypothetical protein [Desulfobacterales bacterium]
MIRINLLSSITIDSSTEWFFLNNKPLIEGMNSYYIKLDNLIKFYQNELGTGCIQIKSHNINGLIFFNKKELSSGVFQDRDSVVEGKSAIPKLLSSSSSGNVTLNLFDVKPEYLYFWSSILDAKYLYSGLSTEFTDLEALILKMQDEKLTGYIDVLIHEKEPSREFIFLNKGNIVGTASSWGSIERLNVLKVKRDILIKKSRNYGGVFNVKKVPDSVNMDISESAKEDYEDTDDSLNIIQQLLYILDVTIKQNKKIKTDFEILLRKKFVEKFEQYPFLDPFLSEFQYSNGKVTFKGKASNAQLLSGVIESINEIASELGMKQKLYNSAASWKKKYSERLAKYGIKL